MTKKATLTELKKVLRKKTQNELVEEIAHLYKTFESVREFYQTSFFNDDSAVLEKYKKIVREAYIFNDSRPYPTLNASVARKAISDYKKVSCSHYGIADIMLTFVEGGIECSNEFGGMDGPFYNSMVSMYKSTLAYLVKEELLDYFDDRLQAILSHNCGILHEIFVQLYEDYRGATV